MTWESPGPGWLSNHFPVKESIVSTEAGSVHFSCPPDLRDEIQKRADREGVSRSLYIRRLILAELGMEPAPLYAGLRERR